MTRSLSIVFAFLFVLAAPAAQAASPAPPDLTGETFLASDIPARGLSQPSGTCTPTGSSSYAFHVEGEAVGPYTGTFVEDGTFTIAPITTPELSSFDATFTITSDLGTVTGTKTLAGDLGPVNVATCGPFTGFVPDEPNSFQFQATARYSANLPQGGSDSGESVVEYGDMDIRNVADTNTFNFLETFTSTAFTSAPGEKSTGGGRIAPDVSFGFVAMADGPKGSCSVVDHVTGTHVKCLDVTSYSQAGNVATFSGDATVDGAATTYTIQVVDAGEPGVSAGDAFSIETQSGYTAGGPLLEGNVQVHG
jgi:hypothetical protein